MPVNVEKLLADAKREIADDDRPMDELRRYFLNHIVVARNWLEHTTYDDPLAENNTPEKRAELEERANFFEFCLKLTLNEHPEWN